MQQTATRSEHVARKRHPRALSALHRERETTWPICKFGRREVCVICLYDLFSGSLNIALLQFATCVEDSRKKHAFPEVT